MTVKEFMEQFSHFKIDEKKVRKIEKVYGATLTEEIQKIISNCSETVFLDEYRVLSFKEIVDAQDDLHVDFKGMNIIPVVDCGDNDFIVYHSNSDEWSKFNIIDNCVFKRKPSIKDLLK